MSQFGGRKEEGANVIISIFFKKASKEAKMII